MFFWKNNPVAKMRLFVITEIKCVYNYLCNVKPCRLTVLNNLRC